MRARPRLAIPQRWRWALGIASVLAACWLPLARFMAGYLPPVPLQGVRWNGYLAWIEVCFAPDGLYRLLASAVLGCLLALAIRRHLPPRAWQAVDHVRRAAPAVFGGLVVVDFLSRTLQCTLPMSVALPVLRLFYLPHCALPLAALVLTTAASLRWQRRHWLGASLTACLVLGSAQAYHSATNWLEDRALARLAWRAEPLCRALERYQADHGWAPMSLDDLVPAYLPAIPRTGWCVQPEFDYRPIIARTAFLTPRGIRRLDFGPHGERLYLYPDDPASLPAAIRACGLPLGGEVMAHWQLRVRLPEHGIDELLLITKDGWRGQRYGRWRAISW